MTDTGSAAGDISLGRFLELSLPAVDVLASLRFYRMLGFVELPAGDIRSWHYAVVADKGLSIGLHGGGLKEAALSFVLPGLAERLQALEAAGHHIESRHLGPEEFHELRLHSPDGHLVQLLEARTFSPGPEGSSRLLGNSCELVLGCANLPASIAFYRTAGFEQAADSDNSLHAGSLRLRLAPQARPGSLALHFHSAEPDSTVQQLETLGLAPSKTPAGSWRLVSPEGLPLIIAGDR